MVVAAADVDETIEDLIDAALVDEERGDSHDGGAEQRRHRQLGGGNRRKRWRW